MGYVPGFAHDLFVSYAHGDDRLWVTRLVDRLEPALKQRLGLRTDIWVDDEALRRSRDVSREIPEAVEASAVFLLLASPSYIRSQYCVAQECGGFANTVPAKRARFRLPDFANEWFAFRCLLLPVDGNEHWTLFPGLTDLTFCNDSETFVPGSQEFETGFRRLVNELVGLLKRMRNASTSVFLYPPHPGDEVAAARTALAAELSAQSYRILPDRTVNVADQVREASMSVFLLGGTFDEAAGELIELAAAERDKAWVAWASPAAEQTADADQSGFCAYVEQLDSPRKTYLNAAVSVAKLKEEVVGLLRPDPRVAPQTGSKPRVYLVYNARDRAEMKNAGLISFHFRKAVHFEHPDDPAQHTARLTRSDGVLLVWGNADEEWCSREFAEIVQTSTDRRVNGLCVFEPVAPKSAAIQHIRSGFGDLFIGEQSGRFDPARLSTFFDPILRRAQEGRA